MQNLFLGFTIGLLTLIAHQRLYNEPQVIQILPNEDMIISAYDRGKKEALRTNPISWELDKACLTIWSERQGNSPDR